MTVIVYRTPTIKIRHDFAHRFALRFGMRLNLAMSASMRSILSMDRLLHVLVFNLARGLVIGITAGLILAARAEGFPRIIREHEIVNISPAGTLAAANRAFMRHVSLLLVVSKIRVAICF